jgi:hypothetical protein
LNNDKRGFVFLECAGGGVHGADNHLNCGDGHSISK